MAKIVILGAGISGHVAASHLRRKLKKEHQVVVVSPNSNYQWIPSNIWVGVGRMKSEKILFPLAPLYKKKGIDFKQAKVVTFHPEGDSEIEKPYVIAEYVSKDKKGTTEKVTYDYLTNATGPKLNFEATEGLVPGTNKTYSVCTYTHADHAWQGLSALIEEMKKGKKAKIVVGTGHVKATCQGAAFEYILNVEQELRRHKVRDMAEVTWISNEYRLGDFGMDGVLMSYGSNIMKSHEMIEMVFEVSGEETSETLTDLERLTEYDVYMKTNCGEEESIFTEAVTFSTIDDYCMIENFEIIEPITYVEFAGIENHSPSGLDETPPHEYFLDIHAEVNRDETYTIIVEGNTGGNYENGITVFFDWNQGEEFNNTTERYDIGVLTNSTGEDGKQVSAVITVPEDAQEGLTRMRVAKEFYANEYIAGACNRISYGQAEDYGVMVGELGVEDHITEDLKVYPNPVVNKLNIQASQQLSSIEVLNLSGQSLLKENSNGTQKTVDLSHLASGVYFVKLEIDGKIKTYKIIKE